MRRHPLEGAIMIARMPGLSTVMLDAMRGCLEHHMNYNRTGYPDVELEWGQATMSRIVAMADCFDAITAHRAYHSRPRTAFEGLQILLGPNRVNFDPAVLWALVRSVGLYPAGTVLQTGVGARRAVHQPEHPDDVTRPALPRARASRRHLSAGNRARGLGAHAHVRTGSAHPAARAAPVRYVRAARGLTPGEFSGRECGRRGTSPVRAPRHDRPPRGTPRRRQLSPGARRGAACGLYIARSRGDDGTQSTDAFTRLQWLGDCCGRRKGGAARHRPSTMRVGPPLEPGRSPCSSSTATDPQRGDELQSSR